MKKFKANTVEELRIGYLEYEFEKRKADQKSFSLRKFAEEAKVDPSTMSQYIRGKRKITEEAFKIMLSHLRVNTDLIESYEKARAKFKMIGESFQLIRKHWYYYTILELTYLKAFKSDAKWISNQLGLPLGVTKKAIEILFEVGALSIENDKYIDSLGLITDIEDINMDVEVGRIHQTELLDLAKQSIQNEEGHIKDHTSTCIAIDTSLLPELKRKVGAFHEEIVDFVEKTSATKDRVYTFQINVFPLNERKLK